MSTRRSLPRPLLHATAAMTLRSAARSRLRSRSRSALCDQSIQETGVSPMDEKYRRKCSGFCFDQADACLKIAQIDSSPKYLAGFVRIANHWTALAEACEMVLSSLVTSRLSRVTITRPNCDSSRKLHSGAARSKAAVRPDSSGGFSFEPRAPVHFES
jgi:hypothetical protein